MNLRFFASSALWLFAVSFIVSLSAAGQVTYIDVTSSAGVNYIQQPPLDNFCTLEGENSLIDCQTRAMTGAIAIGDYDNDGLDDIYVTRMTDTDILYKNNGDGTYLDTSTAAGITALLNTNGAAWADVDNDGDLDLFLTTVDETRCYFYLNNGDGTFVEDAASRGLDLEFAFDIHSGFSIAVGDYNRDGFVDFCTSGWNTFGNFNQPHLLLNRGLDAPGYFIVNTLAAGVDPFNGFSAAFIFAPAFVDLDRDGWQDLAFASDFGHSQLYWNNGDGTFTDEAGSANIGTDENGMGSTFGDVDGDGDMDWFVTSIWDDCTENCPVGPTGNRLYLNNGDRTFTDGTDAFGVRNGDWAWGASFFDYDNDSDLDLVMTNGVVFVEITGEDFWNTDRMRFWENDGNGSTTEVGVAIGVEDTGSGKGLVTFDFDGDGDLDIMVANAAGPSILYANQGGNVNDYIRIKFKAANRPFEGLGAVITVQPEMGGPTQFREMGVATHFLGQSERVAHFGLGTPSANPIHEITVEWPKTGDIQTFNDVARNQTFIVTAPAGAVADPPHDADINGDFSISLTELLRLIQFFNCGEYHIDASSEDGFACGPGDQSGFTHTADFSDQNWAIGLSELLRIIQLFNSFSYYRHFSGDDGYVAGSIA